MQLSFFSDDFYIPPKTQLLKWVGNKQKFAFEITKYFPKEFRTFIEPFFGSGAISATVAPERGIGSDIYTPLIEIWRKLQEDPEGLVLWYKEHRDKMDQYSKEEVFEEVQHSYNCGPNGQDLLFLSRACYGGIIRFTKQGFMSTPCGVHTPISVDSFEKRVVEWHNRLRNVRFFNLDYKEIFQMANNDDFIYCDPPYYDSQSILYGAQGFKLHELFEQIRSVKERGVKVALSIDGHKKSGSRQIFHDIPEGLFENEIFINCGRSMLRRFQLEGQTLENEVVTDRLLLTY